MKFRKMMALCAALALTVCAVSCSGGKADTVSNADVSQSDSTYGVDDGTTFPKGVWAVDGDERRTGYYISMGDGTGYYFDTEYGMGVAFEVEIDGKKANFHMGAADVNNYAEVIISDVGKRRLVWENDGRQEILTLVNGADPETFVFYSASDLLNAAYTYYENEHDGAHPEFFGTAVNVDGTVDIELYDKVNGKKQLAAFYQIDSLTGRGKELNSGEAVDFSETGLHG